MNVAVVDIGTNSTRLLVARLDDSGRVAEELERESIVTRLGRGVDADGSLSDDGMERVYETVGRYRSMIDRHGVRRAIAVLTSAVRDSSNGGSFARTVGERFEIEPFVLSGEDEARLTFLGATDERVGAETPTLVIDIGGGSTEMVIGVPGREPDFHVSNQAGVVRQTERHIRSDPPRPEELSALAADAREIFAAGVPAQWRRAVEAGIGVAGTPTSLAAIAQALEPFDPTKTHGYTLGRGEIEEILGRLAALPLAERCGVAGLHPDRAPTILAGTVMLLQAMELFGLEAVEVSEHDILRGAAMTFARGAPSAGGGPATSPSAGGGPAVSPTAASPSAAADKSGG